MKYAIKGLLIQKYWDGKWWDKLELAKQYDSTAKAIEEIRNAVATNRGPDGPVDVVGIEVVSNPTYKEVRL